MFCGATHTERPRAQTLEPRHQHARKHHGQQEVHHKVPHGLVFGDAILHGKVFEEHMPLQRHHLEAEVGYSLERAYGNKQEPTKSEAGVHITEAQIDLEDANMQQTLSHRLPQRLEGRHRRNTAPKESSIRLRKCEKPRYIPPYHNEEQQRCSHNERQCERCIETH